MSSFISKSACRGNRPSHLVGYRYYQRHRLVSRLLKERGVARFIIAPSGYGKTGLALEYAETMYEFNGVVWVNCKSPCFIRDLDAGDLAKAHVRRDSQTRLVVFEDVPYLDATRANAFSGEIDALLNQRCEVLVTCVPSSDVFGRLQRDRICVSSHDLLLDEGELSLVRDDGAVGMEFLAAAHRHESCRVPVLLWDANPKARRAFLAQELSEDTPADLRLFFVCTAVLGWGSFSDLAAFGLTDRQLVESAMEDYPHLGFDDGIDSFAAPPFDLSDIAAGYRSTLEDLVASTAFEKREDFVFLLADKLVELGRGERACDVVRALCPRKVRMTWVERNARELVAQHAFLALLRLAESVRSAGLPSSQRALEALLEAVCLRALGNEEGACRSAKRCAFDHQVPAETRLLCLLVLARTGMSSLAEQAHAELLMVAATGDLDTAYARDSGWCIVLAQAWCIAQLGYGELAAFWTNAQRDGVDDATLAIMATWFYDTVARDCAWDERERGLPPACDCEAIEQFVRAKTAAANDTAIDYFSGSAGLAMETAHRKGMGFFGGPLPTASLVALRGIEMAIVAQRARYENEQVQIASKRDEWFETHPDNGLDPRKMGLKVTARLSAPILTIKTFGCLEVHIGGEPVDPDLLKGKHVRGLIVLLAASEGREISRDSICGSMWPNSPLVTARKNFYSVWSQLRHVLMLPDGSCPYLVRHRGGCSFNAEFVQSDIARFGEICREFLFEEPDFARWSALLIEVGKDFSSDLIPSETSNELIVRLRDEYRSKLVDALVVATMGFVSTDNARRGVWCAQMAIDRDDTREDAYVALMRAQMASGQRTAAMATFRECRRMLSERLGVDPSPETMTIYQQLLDAEGL